MSKPVVAIIADTLMAARDAADLIEFDVDDLPAAVTIRDAQSHDATAVHDDVPDNRFGTLEHGEASATERALGTRQHTVDIEVINNRVAPTALEPRGLSSTSTHRTKTSPFTRAARARTCCATGS
ncbi:MAG: hypothetical protein U5K38_07510 [Woeseiaceae bacterium]|nr:hypothetical protein [Woeseiaceae bacterium]